MDAQSYFVIIPAYNEELTIKDIVRRTMRYCSNVIVINDGSTDNTMGEICDLDITILENPTNMGKGYSLICGIRSALSQGAEFAIALDGDGQHRPEDIPNLMNVSSGHPHSLVIGTRGLTRRNTPLKRLIANKIGSFGISWAAAFPIRDSQSGFRIYPRKLLEKVNYSQLKADRFLFETNVLIEMACCGCPVHQVTIPVIYNEGGRPSHFRAFRDVYSIARMVIFKIICSGFNPKGFYRACIGTWLKRFSFFSVKFVKSQSNKPQGR